MEDRLQESGEKEVDKVPQSVGGRWEVDSASPKVANVTHYLREEVACRVLCDLAKVEGTQATNSQNQKLM